MSTKNFTFDPESGVPNAADLVIYGGANFKNTFNVDNTSNENYDLTGWSGSAQMQKSAGIGATDIPAATFTVGFSSAYDGQFYISLGSTQTRNLAAGRYEYNVLLTTSLVTETILDTSIAVGATAGIGTTEFTINKLGGVAIGDTVSVGAAITTVAIVGIATTVANKIQIGAAHTSPLEILPGTGVTITRVGQGTTIYNMVNGNILVYAGIASAP